MYPSDKNLWYDAGTFKIGQSIYPIENISHRFQFHKKCTYCDNTGKILIKGKMFKCPNCNGSLEVKEIIEKVVGEPIKIKSVTRFTNNNKSVEVYSSGSSGYGWILCKKDNGGIIHFASREEAQAVCDEYNSKNNVYLLLDEYKRQEIRENL